MLKEKVYETPCGKIYYWINEKKDLYGDTLVFLPGLTADHRLFEKQIEYFEEFYHVFVWDAPGHGRSWPFSLSFTLEDKAVWLDGIFSRENITGPILVGQSMGGYVGQAYMERFPGKARGFVSIGSAPLQRRYVTGPELWLLKRMEPVYRWYPWKLLLKSAVKGCAVSEYGRKLMREMMMPYASDKDRYARLAGHGFQMLAEAMVADRPYQVDCPAVLICGARDRAGSAKRYNKAWHRITGIPIVWIAGAGHNANTDKPEEVNHVIKEWMDSAHNEGHD